MNTHELEIPDQAREAILGVPTPDIRPGSGYVPRGLIDAVVPLAIAAELRRIADALEEGGLLERVLDGIESPALLGILSYLHQRIDHLDPEGLTCDR